MPTRTLGVDWGSTQLRIWLIGDDGEVLDSAKSGDGLKSVTDGDFAKRLIALTDRLKDKHTIDHVILSGMVGARGGWHEVTYTTCPARIDDLHTNAHHFEIEGLSEVPIPAAILPGVMKASQTGPSDIMRGEECQVFGAASQLGEGDFTAVLPGTHSKWITVEDQQITDFTTIMTGELFSLLIEHSLLGQFQDGYAMDQLAFDRGLERAKEQPLSSVLFSARADVLTGSLAPHSVHAYLSGLLIGAELASGLEGVNRDRPICLVAGGALGGLYERAFDFFDRPYNLVDVEAATLAGLRRAASHLFS